jgi:hypothetical protein
MQDIEIKSANINNHDDLDLVSSFLPAEGEIIAMARLRSYLGNSYWGMIKLAKHMIFNAQVNMLATRVTFGWAPTIPLKQCN